MTLEEAIKSTKFKNETHRACVNIMYTAWWLKTITNKALKEYGLTHEQYNVLRILKGKHPQQMCVKDIGSRLIEKNSNVPRIIDRLAIKKLIKREQGKTDRRETVISITAAGITLLEAASKEMETAMTNSVKMNDKDAMTLNSLLEQLRAG
jgi:DNA-binding MarR family transcriptional regulator